ncbi:MAG: endo-1,4-beta-xylanase [Bacteroidales bacterium]
MKKVTVILCFITFIFTHVHAQIGQCKGKYFGNIIAYDTPSNYSDLWNQVTSENGSKWGTCDRGNGNYDFGNSDLSYNWAQNNNGLFKFHALMWGSQAPGYLSDADAATIVTAIRDWYQAVDDHYTPMGGLDMIDVLNEPVNTPINKEISNLKAALTMGYQSEPANQNDLDNPYGWAIWPFQLAREHFPDAILLINEFNIEHNWNNCRAEYITMINAIKEAPNLSDGQNNLIDGVGLQAHGIETLSLSAWEGCLDEMWNSTNLPIHISEIDVAADPNEELQRSQFANFISSAWEHEHVAGITLWGYIVGQTWRDETGIQYEDGTDRPAMTWIKNYFASQPDLACCPDPWPFANCENGVGPSLSITSPTETVFVAPATIPFDVSATDSDGEISNINFYLNNATETFHEEWTTPYAWDWEVTEAGTYNIRVVAYDNDGNTDEENITITVNVPQGPYNRTAAEIPGKIEFEHFDVGGNGYAYSDVDAGTNVDPAPDFRTDEDVDIETCTDTDGGYNIGYAMAGEWLEYTVNVTTSGTYDITIRAACNGDGRTFSLSTDETIIADAVAVPNTEGWQEWIDITIPDVELSAGEQVLRFTIGETDYINLNYMTYTLQEEPSQTFELISGWNLIGCPLEETTNVETALQSIWTYVDMVKDMDGFYLKSNQAELNSLNELSWGKGYLIYVSQDCTLTW